MKRKSFLKSLSFKVQIDLNSNTMFLHENKIKPF